MLYLVLKNNDIQNDKFPKSNNSEISDIVQLWVLSI